MIFATTPGRDRQTAWLPGVSTTVAPARLAMNCCVGGGIILSSVATRYQLGLLRQAARLTFPESASMPHGTWESAMNAALSASTSPANDTGAFAGSSKRNPACGARIGATAAPGGGSLIKAATDSPASGANA